MACARTWERLTPARRFARKAAASSSLAVGFGPASFVSGLDRLYYDRTHATPPQPPPHRVGAREAELLGLGEDALPEGGRQLVRPAEGVRQC